jgi:hypothetical protein
MSTINQLSGLTSVSAGDLLAVWSTNNGDTRRVAISALLAYFQTQFAAPTMATNLYVPSTGFSITVPTPVSQQQWILLQPAAVLATGTIVFPLNTGVPDGTEILITSTQTITALALSANGATTISGTITTIAGGGRARYRFYQATNSWYAI